MKTCKRCERALPLSHFYVHAAMRDGYLNICKSCTRARVIKHRLKNVERARAYDRERSKRPERKAADYAKVKNKRRHEGPVYQRAHAHDAVRYAIERGDLVRPDRCGKCRGKDDGTPCRAIAAHHDDYARPLDVLWLCPGCHAQRHLELGRLQRA